jgi:hypothetical protein
VEGYYRTYRIRAVPAIAANATAWKSSGTVRRNYKPSNVSNVAVTPQSYYSGTVKVTWSAATSQLSSISNYTVSQAISTDGGTTWGTIAAVASVTAPTLQATVTPPTNLNIGDMVRYYVHATDALGDVSANYVGGAASTITKAQSACDSPNLVSVSTLVVALNGSLTLAWSGAIAGAGAPITGFHVEYSESSDGTTWGAWGNRVTVSGNSGSGNLSVQGNGVRGRYRRWRIRTITSAGEAYYSGWVMSPTVRTNVNPTGPSSFTASPETYTAPSVTLTWSGTVKGTSDLTYYYIQKRESTDNGATWDAWVRVVNIDVRTSQALSGSTVVTPSSVLGTTTEYRIFVGDALGENSTARSATVKIYGPPSAPSVVVPVEDASYSASRRPRFYLTTKTASELQKVTVQIFTAAGAFVGQYDSVNNPACFTSPGWLGNGVNTIFTPPNSLSYGETYRFSVYASDASDTTNGAVRRTITLTDPSFETVTANVTHVKAEHMNRIFAATRTILLYFGYPPVLWRPPTIEPKRTQVRDFPLHVWFARNYLQDVLDFAAAFDRGIMPFAAFAWEPMGNGRPRAAVLSQLQQIITTI